jgi:hypothetical protein
MLGVAAGIAILMLGLPPIPQSASYHQFADQRRWLGTQFWQRSFKYSICDYRILGALVSPEIPAG